MGIEKENKEKKFLEVPLHSPIEGYTDEMNSYYQSHLPHGHRLARATDVCDTQQTTRFLPGGFFDKFKARAASRILRLADQVVGPLYAEESLLSQEWKNIFHILEKKDFFHKGDVFPIQPRNDDPKCFFVGTRCHISQYDFFIGGKGMKKYTGYGISHKNFSEAISKAIGEALERFGILPHAQYATFLASINDLQKLGKRFLNPEDYAVFSDEQKEWFPQMRFDASKPLRWVEGKHYLSERRILLPAQFVFWGYQANEQDEVTYRELDTNGAAGMFTREEAILAGLYELIQRDGFVVHWLWNSKPPRIDLNTIQDEENRILLDTFQRYRIRCEVLDISTNVGIPVFLSILIDDALPDKYRLVVGAGCDLRWQKALYKALLESMALFQGSRFVKSFLLPEQYQPFQDRNIQQFERFGLWLNASMFSHISPFLEGPRVSADDLTIRYRKCSEEKESPLAFLTQELGRLGNGYEIYYYDAPHPLLRDIGYHAVKVIVPALVPLYLREMFAPLGSRRLLGAKEWLKSETGVFPNTIPHPFP